MLRLLTMGQVSLERDGVRVSGAAGQPRRLAVLAVLAAAGSRGISRERLIGLLWTDTEEERARKGLNQALYALRQEIGSDSAISGTRDLVLSPEHVQSDIEEFRSAIARGNFERAAAVYQGPFLEGLHLPDLDEFERWLELERARLARDHATTLERLARRAEERNNHDAAIGWWRRLAACDPLDGKTTLHLMSALLRAGDRVGALKQARIYEVLLAEQLDLPPDGDVIALAEHIRQLDVQPTVPPATTPAAPDAMPAASTRELPVEPAAAGEGERAADVPNDVAGHQLPQRTGIPTERRTLPEVPAGRTSRRLPMPSRRWLAAAALVLLATAGVSLAGWPDDDDAPTLGAARKITFDSGLELDPVLSPDGAWLAYAAGTEGAMRIYVRRVEGGRSIRVSGEEPGDHRYPRWSPDGSRLLFQANGTIWLVPALGGATRPVITAPDEHARALYADWSPDGSQLAWVQRDSILVRDLSGGPVRALATLPTAHSLAWSPDGRWIAAVSGNEGFVYGAGSSTMSIGYISIGNLAPTSVFVVPARGGEPVRVAGGDHLHTSPAWFGRDRLLFVSDRDGARDLFLTSVNRSGRPTGPPVRLTTGVSAHTVFAQRDGRALAYSVFTQSSNIWALPIPRGDPIGTAAAVPITSGTQTVEGLEVSPDGQWLAFDADGGGSQDIYRLPLAGGETERVVENPTGDHRPSWAPDGLSLLYYSFVDGYRRAFTVPLDGRAPPAPLSPPDTADQHTPVWSLDMQRVLFHRWMGDIDQIFEVTRTADSTWSAERQITRNGGFGPRWSPDGKQLAYIVRGEVRLMPDGPDGESAARVLLSAGSAATDVRPVAVRWAPDGRTLYVKTFDLHANAAIWAVDVNGGAPRLLVRFDEPHRPTRRPEFTTDGERFYFTLAQSESDVWLIGVKPR
jgi:Tol biopolymer transport system component/DNA-binding SARP family transcriptional activator